VTYHVSIKRVFKNESLSPITEFTRAFPGTERKAATVLFEKLKKEHNGIICVVDLTKKAWEAA
jgi:hypothetical protein